MIRARCPMCEQMIYIRNGMIETHCSGWLGGGAGSIECIASRMIPGDAEQLKTDMIRRAHP